MPIFPMRSHSMGMKRLPLTLWERVTLAGMIAGIGAGIGTLLTGVAHFLQFALPLFH